jgi:uncharacterized protein
MSLFEKCKERVEGIHSQFDASHDFTHIERVLKNAEEIMLTESSVEVEVVRLAILLHDIEDAKYKTEDNPTVELILEEIGADEQLSDKVRSCIDSVSYSGGNTNELTSLEGAIVRDADRLDAIGAIGIARTFAYGGAKGRKLYDASEGIRASMSEVEYRTKETASVTHFHEKLLLLKNLMTTSGGKRIAEERHTFMESFLKQLSTEIGE